MSDPFSVLGLAPTLDLTAIKRAYFVALAKHPPHRDVAAFRQVRDAYERLSDPRTRTLAVLATPIDRDAGLARFDAAWGERIARARADAEARRDGERAIASFVARTSRMTVIEARAANEAEQQRYGSGASRASDDG